jgi:hypothetical protein
MFSRFEPPRVASGQASCSCGATISVSAITQMAVREQLRDFYDVHRPCRVRANENGVRPATPSDTKEKSA